MNLAGAQHALLQYTELGMCYITCHVACYVASLYNTVTFVWNHFQYSCPILVRVHPGRPAALPTATGWDEELRARTAGVRLPRPGHSESSFWTESSICPVMLSHRYRYRMEWLADLNRCGLDERPKLI